MLLAWDSGVDSVVTLFLQLRERLSLMKIAQEEETKEKRETIKTTKEVSVATPEQSVCQGVIALLTSSVLLGCKKAVQ